MFVGQARWVVVRMCKQGTWLLSWLFHIPPCDISLPELNLAESEVSFITMLPKNAFFNNHGSLIYYIYTYIYIYLFLNKHTILETKLIFQDLVLHFHWFLMVWRVTRSFRHLFPDFYAKNKATRKKGKAMQLQPKAKMKLAEKQMTIEKVKRSAPFVISKAQLRLSKIMGT